MNNKLENIDTIEKEIQNKKAFIYDELFFQTLAEFPLRKKIAQYLNKMKVNKNAKIIDIGCGTGELLKYLENEGYNSLYGNDISDEMIKIAQTKVKNCTFYLGSINKAEINSKFDFIIITEVLHHIPDLQNTFKTLKSLLSKKGKIVFLEPSSEWFFENVSPKKLIPYIAFLIFFPLFKISFLKNKKLILNNCQYDTPDTFNPYHRHLNPNEVLSSAGMNVEVVKYFSLFTGLFDGILFKNSVVDFLIYKFISLLDSILPFNNKGKYFFLVLTK
jgi:ubiquinone/menaquinone biosynthesis C-methylase UbiE